MTLYLRKIIKYVIIITLFFAATILSANAAYPILSNFFPTNNLIVP
jgi:hypothetical protein